MPLDLIIGACGSGKTAECIRRIMQLEQAGENVIYLVPQQFTLESERLLLEKSAGCAIMKTRVLSFRRLAYVIMNDSDVHKPVLSATGRAFLLRRIVYENRDSLEYFSKVIDKQGFLDSLVNLFTEFYQYEVTPEKLIAAYEGVDKNDSLSLKLKDMHLIYSIYREHIAKNYAAAEETLDILAAGIKESDYVKNCHIFIDSMDYFIPQEYSVIQRLMLHAKSVTVALNGDFSSLKYGHISPYDPYYEAKRTAARLVRIAGESKCAVNKPLFLGECMRHKGHADMLHLHKNYFANTPIPYAGVPENIHIMRAADMAGELDAVCRKIKELVMVKKIRYDSIAVIIDPSYEADVKRRFTEYGIPVFLDSKRPVTGHPLTALILSVLDILCSGPGNMLVYAKNYFSPADSEDVFYLENYMLKHSLGASAWRMKEWNFGFGTEESEEKILINAVKDELTGSLEKIRRALKPGKKYRVEFITEKIYDFLFGIGADKRLTELAESSRGDMNAFRRHSRIWDELVNVFETMAEITDAETDLAEFTALLRSGLELCGISMIPPTQDTVIIGDIDRSRLPRIDTLFMLGVNEGKIPPYADDIGLLGDRERTLLTENYFEMAANDLRRINMMDLNIYSLLLKPDSELYVSCTAFGSGGKRSVQSSVITRLMKLFPEIKIGSDEYSGLLPAPVPAFEDMVRDMRLYCGGSETDGDTREKFYNSYDWFRHSNEYSDRLDMLRTAADDELSKRANNNLKLNEASLKKLYDDTLSGSVSKLESYAECPFAYFLKYGLGIREREEYEFDSIRLGNLFHSVLEGFSAGLKAENTDWRTLGEDDVRTRVENCVDGIIPEAFNEIIAADPRFVYTVKRVKNIMTKSVNALCSHVRSGLFTPYAFETEFGAGKTLPPIVFQLENNKKIVLNGKIDRIDILENDGEKFVKIIDYKSGNRDFSRSELYYGMQLQLILYMDSYLKTAHAKNAADLLPAGVFYFKVSNPMIEKNGGEADIEKMILEQYDMNGLVLNESAVTDAIGKKTEPKNARSKAKIETLNHVETVDRAGFAKLCEDAEEIVKALGSEMLDGNIDISPVKCGRKTGCDYCGYGSICRFDVRENAAYRTGPVKTKDSGEEDGK